MVVGAEQVLRYAITHVSALAPATSLDAGHDRRMRLREDLRRWAKDGIDFVQLREKELEAGEIFALAAEAMRVLRALGCNRRPKLLVNGRPDIAAAAHADGVHLTAHPGELRPAQVREMLQAAGLPRCLVSVSCHTLPEVTAAHANGADLILFGPVFEKRAGGDLVVGGLGLEALRRACVAAGPMPVLALGGVTAETAEACRQAGAAGVAGIRPFGLQEDGA